MSDQNLKPASESEVTEKDTPSGVIPSEAPDTLDGPGRAYIPSGHSDKGTRGHMRMFAPAHADFSCSFSMQEAPRLSILDGEGAGHESLEESLAFPGKSNKGTSSGSHSGHHAVHIGGHSNKGSDAQVFQAKGGRQAPVAGGLVNSGDAHNEQRRSLDKGLGHETTITGESLTTNADTVIDPEERMGFSRSSVTAPLDFILPGTYRIDEEDENEKEDGPSNEKENVSTIVQV